VAKGKYQKWLTPEGLTLLQGWARDGLTDEQIAHNLGISAKTLYEWKNKYGKICEALKKGKEVVDYEVESALCEKAKSGDVGACVFWLKNRRPDKWRDHPADTQTDKAENNLLEQIRKSAKEVDAKCSTDDSDKSS
jgi:hypothetical protein